MAARSDKSPHLVLVGNTIRCTVCGVSEPTPMPMPIDHFIAWTRSFERWHATCLNPRRAAARTDMPSEHL